MFFYYYLIDLFQEICLQFADCLTFLNVRLLLLLLLLFSTFLATQAVWQCLFVIQSTNLVLIEISHQILGWTVNFAQTFIVPRGLSPHSSFGTTMSFTFVDWCEISRQILDLMQLWHGHLNFVHNTSKYNFHFHLISSPGQIFHLPNTKQANNCRTNDNTISLSWCRH